MSLVYTAIVPHPPIIIAEIGGDQRSAVRGTISSMKKIAESFNELEIDAALVISPHAKLSSFAMTICRPKQYQGDLSEFGKETPIISVRPDTELADDLIIESDKGNIPIGLDEDGTLDHGALVPLYFINKAVDFNFNLVEIGYSGLSIEQHLDFGHLIYKVTKNSKKRVALIISGDLSHRHFDNYYKKYALEFDSIIKNKILSGCISGIEQTDPELVELSGECGFRSLVIASGVLNQEKNKFRLLSYEAPFGVGYLVADLVNR